MLTFLHCPRGSQTRVETIHPWVAPRLLTSSPVWEGRQVRSTLYPFIYAFKAFCRLARGNMAYTWGVIMNFQKFHKLRKIMKLCRENTSPKTSFQLKFQPKTPSFWPSNDTPKICKVGCCCWAVIWAAGGMAWHGRRPACGLGCLGMLQAAWWHLCHGLLVATLRHQTTDLESRCPSPWHFRGPLLSTQMVTRPRAKRHGVDLARQPMTPCQHWEN